MVWVYETYNNIIIQFPYPSLFTENILLNFLQMYNQGKGQKNWAIYKYKLTRIVDISFFGVDENNFISISNSMKL